MYFLSLASSLVRIDSNTDKFNYMRVIYGKKKSQIQNLTDSLLNPTPIPNFKDNSEYLIGHCWF